MSGKSAIQSQIPVLAFCFAYIYRYYRFLIYDSERQGIAALSTAPFTRGFPAPQHAAYGDPLRAELRLAEEGGWGPALRLVTGPLDRPRAELLKMYKKGGKSLSHRPPGPQKPDCTPFSLGCTPLNWFSSLFPADWSWCLNAPSPGPGERK